MTETSFLLCMHVKDYEGHLPLFKSSQISDALDCDMHDYCWWSLWSTTNEFKPCNPLGTLLLILVLLSICLL
jgi:hypothetical protein